MLKRLRIKFVCINMIIVTSMLCIIFGMIYYFTCKELKTQSIQMMQEVSANPFQLGLPWEAPDEIRLPYFMLQVGQNGELLAVGGGYYDLSNEDFLKEILDLVFASGKQNGILEAYDLRFYCSTLQKTQRIVFADISSERTTLENLVQNCILIGILSFLVFFVISVALARWAVKPVDQAWKQQRQFIADASHELKTPLTVILTNAELLQSTDCDEKSRVQFSNSILTMSHQMRGLVEGLLQLARVDNGSAKMTFSMLDFSQLVSNAALPFEPLYFEKGLMLDCRIKEGISVRGSASHLQQVIDILLDNAMKYSTPETTVSMTLKKQGIQCLLSVTNTGEHLSSEELKNIFKRFYRIDKVRSMSHSYGLGLPIAEGIIKEHHGKIWAESVRTHNTFFVQLPLAF